MSLHDANRVSPKQCGAVIRRLRRAQGLTQEQLRARIDEICEDTERTERKGTMRCSPVVVLALAALLLPAHAQNTIQVGGRACPPEGTATSEAGKALNRHKNRDQAPTGNDVDGQVSLTAMLAPGTDFKRFDQERGASVQGYVIDVKPGGKESCNCDATAQDQCDTHIELALAAGAPPAQRIIVEVTPRLRQQMAKRGIDWTTATLHRQLKRKWVEVGGWMLFDSMHVDAAENTNPGNPKNWRATCWEIHPVTNIKVLPGAPAAAKNFRPESFQALHALHAAHISRNPAGQAALAKQREAYLSKFDQKELEEARSEKEAEGR